jgi:hypothetical protein
MCLAEFTIPLTVVAWVDRSLHRADTGYLSALRGA